MASNRAIEHRNRVLGLLLMPVAFFVLASLVTYSVNDYPNSSLGPEEVLNAGGKTGAIVASVLFITWGYGAYGVPLLLIIWAWNRLYHDRAVSVFISTAVVLCSMTAGVTFVSLIEGLPADVHFYYGGAVGLRVAQLATASIGPGGAMLASVLVFILAPLLLWISLRRTFRRRSGARMTVDLKHQDTEPLRPSDTVPARFDPD